MMATITSVSGNCVQVQWNACYALGSLFRAPAAVALALQSGVLKQHIGALLQLIESSPSYKVGMQHFKCNISLSLDLASVMDCI